MERMIDAKGAERAATAKFDMIGFLARFAPLIFLILLMAVFAIAEPRFLTPLNLFNVLRQVSIYGLLAIGMTFVILTAGIDLSVGSPLPLPVLSRPPSPRAASPTAFRSAKARTRWAMAGNSRRWLRSLLVSPAASCRAGP